MEHPSLGAPFTLALPPPRGAIAGTAFPVSVTCGARVWPLEPIVQAGPTNGGPLCLGDSFWNIIVQEGHKLSRSLLCASGIHFLALGKKKIKNLCVCVDVCTGGSVSEDESSKRNRAELFLGILSPNSAV